MRSQEISDLFVRNSLLEGSIEKQSGSQENWRDLFPEIIGESLSLENVLQMVVKIAKSNSSVLILGESGTGKELIAAAIHRLSPRSHKCFVAINCSAIPEELLEAELFGHEKGAFTGADRKRIGHFGVAHGGTIFLDEIGDMPARLQAKLLRVLQEKQFSSVGSTEIKQCDIRFIAATNKNLEKAVKDQTFRLDLYYRLNVLPIMLPALAQRLEDVPPLISYFSNQLHLTHPHLGKCWFDKSVLQVLSNYNWPGNVRQLQNLIERLFIMKGNGCIMLEDLPKEILAFSPGSLNEPIRSGNASEQVSFASILKSSANPQLPSNGINLCDYIETLENQLIKQALERTNYNKNQAAKLLGLNRTTLVERIKKRKILDQE